MSEKKKRATRAELRQTPKEFTPRYHVNETLRPCPECRPENAPACLDCARIASSSTETPPCCAACLKKATESCATCGDVRLVYVTGTPSTENDASPS